MGIWKRRHAERDAGDVLEPLVVDSSARSGTTMTMALLASSPEVAMDRTHPYEHAYFAWLTEWTSVADSVEWDLERWNWPELAWRQSGRAGNGLVGPPPWIPRPLWDVERPGEEMGPRLLRAAWREFSEQAIARTRRDLGAPQARVRYHAEKATSAARLRELSRHPIRALVLYRDPRDIWLSTLAFDEARGFRGFGRPAGEEGEDAWFERFLAIQADRLRATIAERGRGDSLLIAYEDLVSQPEATAERLGEWLGVELDPAAPARELERHSSHATSPSPAMSIARWRRELEPRLSERFVAVMGPELRELGYES